MSKEFKLRGLIFVDLSEHTTREIIIFFERGKLNQYFEYQKWRSGPIEREKGLCPAPRDNISWSFIFAAVIQYAEGEVESQGCWLHSKLRLLLQ